MKRIFTLAIFNLVALFSFADDHHNDGTLSITNFSNRDIRVEVDGHFYNDKNNVVMIRDIAPGYHTIMVYREKGNGKGRDFFNNRGRKQVLYSNRVYIKPRFEVEVVIDRNGKAQVKESPVREPWFGGRDNDYGRDRRDRDYRNDRNNRDDRRYNAPMDNRAFNSSLESLRREMFESTRYEMARQLIDRNLFTVDQVMAVVHLFAFENNKLELAKCAYSNTVDRQYYAKMYNELDFDSSRRELAQYMNEYR